MSVFQIYFQDSWHCKVEEWAFDALLKVCIKVLGLFFLVKMLWIKLKEGKRFTSRWLKRAQQLWRPKAARTAGYNGILKRSIVCQLILKRCLDCRVSHDLFACKAPNIIIHLLDPFGPLSFNEVENLLLPALLKLKSHLTKPEESQPIRSNSTCFVTYYQSLLQNQIFSIFGR